MCYNNSIYFVGDILWIKVLSSYMNKTMEVLNSMSIWNRRQFGWVKKWWQPFLGKALKLSVNILQIFIKNESLRKNEQLWKWDYPEIPDFLPNQPTTTILMLLSRARVSREYQSSTKADRTESNIIDRRVWLVIWV